MPTIEIHKDGSKTVHLDYPLEKGPEGNKLASVTFRRIKGKDLRVMAERNHNLFWLISQLSGVAGPFIDELDGEDIAMIQDVVNGFLKSGQATGEA